MIFSITNPTELVDWLQIFCKRGWLSPWDPPLQWGKIHERSYRPATHPIHFAADSPRQNPSLRCMGGIFLYGNLSGQSPSILLRKTVPLLKSPTGAFIATLRLKTQTAPWKFHEPSERDTGFLSTPLQNRGRNFVRSKRRSTYTSSGTLYLFLRLNNSETITQKQFWAQR